MSDLFKMLSEIVFFWESLFFIYGLMLGSFANVLIHRVPKKKNWFSCRSQCPKCSKKIFGLITSPFYLGSF